MATSDPQTIPASFAPLEREQFLALTTFRKNGQGIPTTVWFAFADGALVVVTGPESGKVKRIRNHSRVTLTPSDRTGHTHGASIEGTARIVTADSPEGQAAEAALSKKYGLQRKLIRAAMHRQDASVYLLVTPVI